ncbi:MAG TPA: DUF1402 family protein [Bauldia sp.]|nr:DUF1402 family protein [Bauldia sp.]
MTRNAPASTTASLLVGLGLAAALLAAAASPALADSRIIVVPPGNRSATQPDISSSSIKRTAETNGSFEGKYQAVYQQLAGNPQLIDKIVKTAAVYGIDPIHIIGAIVGEHTYNVDVMDNLQGYYVQALSYLDSNGLRFAYKNEDVEDFVQRPEFAECAASTSDYELWDCRDRVWRTVFQGKNVDGKDWPDDRFERVFFQPFFAGQTFGLGQLSPLSALSVSDVVHAKVGLPLLDINQAPKVYAAVMDPDQTLNYMAALIAADIETYKDIAGFDISQNPGLTATLYNTGQAPERAAALAAENKKRRAAGQSPLYPRENYYGWLINAKLDELRKLLPAGATASAATPPAPPAKSN